MNPTKRRIADSPLNQYRRRAMDLPTHAKWLESLEHPHAEKSRTAPPLPSNVSYSSDRP